MLERVRGQSRLPRAQPVPVSAAHSIKVAVLLAGVLERLGVPVVEEGAALSLSVSRDGRTLSASVPEERVRTALAGALSASPAAPTGPGLYCVDPAFVLDADGLCAGTALAVLGA